MNGNLKYVATLVIVIVAAVISPTKILPAILGVLNLSSGNTKEQTVVAQTVDKSAQIANTAKQIITPVSNVTKAVSDTTRVVSDTRKEIKQTAHDIRDLGREIRSDFKKKK